MVREFPAMGNAVTAPVCPDDILTDAEVCALLKITSRTLRLWRHTRGLPHIKLTNREIRYRRFDLNAWLARHAVSICA